MTTRSHAVPVLALTAFVAAVLVRSAPIDAQGLHILLGLLRGNNTLVVFTAAAPGTIIATAPVTGLVTGDVLRGIDIRPANGLLYGLGVNVAGEVRLYTISLETLVATPLPTVVPPGFTSGNFWGMSFNAVVDRVRVVDDLDANLRLNPNTGTVAGVDPVLTPVSVIVESIAYDNQIRGATTTTLFALNLNVNGLARIGGINVPPGTPSANTGITFDVGPVGPVFGSTPTGLDIASDGTVYAVVRPLAANPRLYTIDRATGAGTLIGTVGTSLIQIDNITILERPLAVADGYATPFGTPLTVPAPGVLLNDSDPDNSPLTVKLVIGPAHGGFSLAPNGSFSYTPAPGFSGLDSFVYSPYDGAINGFQTTVTLAVAANQPPILTPPASQTVVDDGPGVTSGPLAIAVADPEGAATSLIATTSDPTVIAPSGIALGGSGGSRTVTLMSVPGSNGGTTTIRLIASDGYASTEATFNVTVLPRRGRPRALANLSARNNASLQWQAPPFSVEAVTGYVLEAGYSPGATAVSLALAASSLATPAPDGIYYVRVRSQTSGGLSEPSNEVVVALGQAAPPLAPLALLATIQGNNVTLQWTENPFGPVITAYQLSVGSTPGASDLLTVPLSTATSVSAAGPPGTYYVRVAALNAAGAGNPSNEATLVLAPGTCTIPAVPTGLQATVTAGIVTVRWTAPASGAIPASYRLEAGSTPGASNIGVFTLPQTTIVTSPAAAGPYYVRLAAQNSCGSSALTPEINFTMP